MKAEMYKTLLEVETERYLDALEEVSEQLESEGGQAYGAEYELRTARLTEQYEKRVEDLLFDARCNCIFFKYVCGEWKPLYAFLNRSKMA